jgi:hypothetical protein
MRKRDLTRTRQNRIIDEILVDAHGSEEQAHYYLDAKLHFPFLARCTEPRLGALANQTAASVRTLRSLSFSARCAAFRS